VPLLDGVLEILIGSKRYIDHENFIQICLQIFELSRARINEVEEHQLERIDNS